MLGSRSASFILGAVSLVLFGALFTKPAIATAALFEMVVALFVTLGFRWSGVGLVRYGKEEFLRNQSIRETSSTRLTISVPLLVVLVGIIYLYRDTLSEYVGTDDATIPIFIAIDLALLTVRDHIVGLYSAAERHPVNAAANVSLSVGKLMVLGVFWLGWTEATAETYVKLLVGVDAAVLVFHLSFLKARYLWPWRPPSRQRLSEMLRFVLPQIYGFAALYLINWIDTYVIRLYLSSEELGGYQFAYSMFMRIGTPAFIVTTLFFPRIIAWNQTDPALTHRFTRIAPGAILAGTGLIALIGIVLSDPVLTAVFGSKYEDAYPSFYLMLAALPFFFLAYTYVPILNAVNRVAIVQASTAVAAGVNVVIDLLLVEHFGIVAAALGTFVALQVRAIILMLAVNRAAGLPLYPLLIPSLGATALAVGYFLSSP